MTESKDRRLELKVGIFVLVTLLAGLGVVLLLGQRRQLFSPRVPLYARFVDVAGLRPGAPVWLAGVNVGTVSRITFSPEPAEKRVRVDFEVTREMLARITQDSTARIDTQGLLGDKIVSLSVGSPAAPPVEPGGEVQSAQAVDIATMMTQASEILARVKVIADSAAETARALADPQAIATFRASLGSVRKLLERVESGPGLMHALFYDKKTEGHVQDVAEQLDRVAAQLEKSMRRVEGILAATDQDGRQILNNLSRAAAAVGDTAQAVNRSQVVANLERASADLALLAELMRSGRGTIGALISDPTVYEQLVTILGGVQRSRVLRALVRHAIAKDEGRSAARVVEAAGEKPPPPLPPIRRERREDRAGR